MLRVHVASLLIHGCEHVRDDSRAVIDVLNKLFDSGINGSFESDLFNQLAAPVLKTGLNGNESD